MTVNAAIIVSVPILPPYPKPFVGNYGYGAVLVGVHDIPRNLRFRYSVG